MEDVLYKNLLLELECPVCSTYMAPPIRQCTTGHSICEKCRFKLSKCPLCEGSFTEAKNLSLETLAAQIKYPCVNHGCDVKLSLVNREYHEKNCSHRGFSCAMPQCGWVGPQNSIAAHWNEKKITTKPCKTNSLCHVKLKPELFFVNLVEAHNELFWIKNKVTKGTFYFAVQYIGAADKADSFFYEIEFFKPGRPKRKLSLGDYCQGVHLQLDDLFQPGMCSNVSVQSLNNYIGIDNVLIYNFKVYPAGKKEVKVKKPSIPQNYPTKNPQAIPNKNKKK